MWKIFLKGYGKKTIPSACDNLNFTKYLQDALCGASTKCVGEE